MPNKKRTILIIIGITFALFFASLLFRKQLLVLFFNLPITLQDISEDQGTGVTWFDDYYTIHWIDEQTVAIGEPRYEDAVWSYLLLGEERALLLDAGTGIRNIQTVTDGLTDLPITVLPSHFHCDHIGNIHRFETVWLLDPSEYGEARPDDDIVELNRFQHVCDIMNMNAPDIYVDHWVSDGEQIDLGGRVLAVQHIGGHSPESLILLEDERQYAYLGDYIVPGAILTALPGGDMHSYVSSLPRLLQKVSPSWRLWAAHRPFLDQGTPELSYKEVDYINEYVTKIIAGELGEKRYLPYTILLPDNIFGSHPFEVIIDPLPFFWRLFSS